MPNPTPAPLVAIVNSNQEFIEAVSAALQSDGFRTIAARLADVQDGTLDLVAFIDLYDPSGVVAILALKE